MRVRHTTALLLSAACACASSSLPDEGSSSPPYTFVPPLAIDAGGPVHPCAERVPEDDFGTSIGRSFEGFVLSDCEGDDYDFHGDEFCDARLSVVIVAAGWCGPSRVLAGDLAGIAPAYMERGVRFIEVHHQTEDYTAPDREYCRDWTETFGLPNVELIDPVQTTAPLFPTGILPEWIIVDRFGVLRVRETGSDVSAMTAALDALLAE